MLFVIILLVSYKKYLHTYIYKLNYISYAIIHYPFLKHTITNLIYLTKIKFFFFLST